MPGLTVIQTLPALEVGGVERGTLEVAAELVRRGHRSIVISAGGRLVSELTGAGSEHITLPIGKKSPLTLRYIRTLREILRATGADILHARSRLPAWISYLAWRGMPERERPRFITTVHGPNSVNRYSKVMTYGEQVIAVSRFMQRYILASYPDTDPGRITVIPRGVSPTAFPHGYRPDPDWLSRWQRDFPLLSDRFLLTLPGRISRRKGIEDFFALISACRDTIPEVHGLIVGGPPPGKRKYFRQLQKTAHAMGLDEHITFAGHRGDVREIFSISNIVFMLSVKPESFGRTALEALTLGTPVIAYDHGGISEVLQTILPEGLVGIGDLAGLTERVKEFHRSKPRVPAGHPYTLQRMLDDTLGLYQTAAQRQPTG